MAFRVCRAFFSKSMSGFYQSLRVQGLGFRAFDSSKAIDRAKGVLPARSLVSLSGMQDAGEEGHLEVHG